MEQIKKDSNDPDFDKLSPDIIKIARTNGFVRQRLELFLHGELTWTEALETMVISLYGQFKETQSLCSDILSDRPTTALLLSSSSGGLLKSLPSRPFNHETETVEQPTCDAHA